MTQKKPKDSSLSESRKSLIRRLAKNFETEQIIGILDSVSTPHAGTAKTKDKRFVIRELENAIGEGADSRRLFYKFGKRLCTAESGNAKEVGVSLVWRGYSESPENVMNLILKTADDNNWEVREYAASALIRVVAGNPELYHEMLRLASHNSENVRRAVLFSALAFRNVKECPKGFKIISLFLSDSSVYVRRNLGPFILGSHFGNALPLQTFEFLKKIIKSDDRYVLWNAAMSFNNSFGRRNPDEAMEVLKCLLVNEDRFVKNAAKSSLRHLSHRHPDAVRKFCKANGITLKK
ncbi:MAG: DNA alkylation repair protein [Ignavibacteria bacterium]|nr:DNA alkylation repair protein [Ignavibacteria bacterium]